MLVMISPGDQRLSKDASSHKLWKIGFTLFVLAGVFFIFTGTIANIDLWINLQAGLDNIANRGLATIDQYSYLTEGQRWVNYEWLAQVVFAFAWLLGDVLGLIILKLVLGFATIGIIYWSLHLQRVNLVMSGVIILIGSVLLASDFTTIYPQLYSLPLFALLLFIFLRAEEGMFRWLWLTPLIFWIWGNLDAGILVGLFFYISWVFMQLLTDWLDWKKILVPAGISVFVTLLNPFGISLYRYLFLSSNENRPEILTWSPLTLLSPLGIIYIFTLVVSIIGIVYSRRHRSTPLIILFALAAMLPFIAKRYLSFYAVAGMILAGEHIADLILNLKWVRQARQAPKWAGIIALLAALGLMIISIPGLNRIAISQSPPYPVQAVQIIKESRVSGNLATEYNWGGYAIWHLGPDVKVSIDGRREMVYSPEIYTMNMAFLLGLGDWSEILTGFPTDMVLVNDHSPVFSLMKLQPGWSLIYQDDAAALYVRQGSSLKTPLRQAASQFTPVTDTGNFP